MQSYHSPCMYHDHGSIFPNPQLMTAGKIKKTVSQYTAYSLTNIEVYSYIINTMDSLSLKLAQDVNFFLRNILFANRYK